MKLTSRSALVLVALVVVGLAVLIAGVLMLGAGRQSANRSESNSSTQSTMEQGSGNGEDSSSVTGSEDQSARQPGAQAAQASEIINDIDSLLAGPDSGFVDSDLKELE